MNELRNASTGIAVLAFLFLYVHAFLKTHFQRSLLCASQPVNHTDPVFLTVEQCRNGASDNQKYENGNKYRYECWARREEPDGVGKHMSDRKGQGGRQRQGKQLQTLKIGHGFPGIT